MRFERSFRIRYRLLRFWCVLIISHVQSSNASYTFYLFIYSFLNFFSFRFTKHAVFAPRIQHFDRDLENMDQVVPLRVIALSGFVTITHSAPVSCHEQIVNVHSAETPHIRWQKTPF